MLGLLKEIIRLQAVNDWLEKNPGGVIIGIAVLILVYWLATKVAPWIFGLWVERRERVIRDAAAAEIKEKEEIEQAHKEDSRTTLDRIHSKIEFEMATKDDLVPIQKELTEVHTHLKQVNGSFTEHTKDDKIHFHKDSLVTLQQLDEKLDKFKEA